MYLGYYEKFKGAPTILLAGSKTSIVNLMSIFSAARNNNIDLLDMLSKQEEIRVLSILSFHIINNYYDKLSYSDGCVTWHVSSSLRDQIIGMLSGLIETSDPGHQYLNSDKIQIICSKDEYDF